MSFLQWQLHALLILVVVFISGSQAKSPGQYGEEQGGETLQPWVAATNEIDSDQEKYVRVSGETEEEIQEERKRSFLRIGRTPRSAGFLRIGKVLPEKRFMRFGRIPHTFLRIGRAGKTFLRIGRAAARKTFLRIGRSVETPFEDQFTKTGVLSEEELQFLIDHKEILLRFLEKYPQLIQNLDYAYYAFPRQGRAMSYYFSRMGRLGAEDGGDYCCQEGVRRVVTSGKGTLELCPRDHSCCGNMEEITNLYKNIVITECIEENIDMDKIRDYMSETR